MIRLARVAAMVAAGVVGVQALVGPAQAATVPGVITEFPIPTVAAAPSGIAAGPDGNLWFTQQSATRIGRITSGMSPADRRPALSGSGQVGLPLVCAADVWGFGLRAAVSWQRGGTTIPGESGVVYTPTAADVGSAVTCSSTGSPAAVLATMTAVSNPITVVPQVTGPEHGEGHHEGEAPQVAQLQVWDERANKLPVRHILRRLVGADLPSIG